jgi:hypothetical protein
MIEPVKMADFFITFFSAAMIILSGALYALLFAWSRVHARPGLMPWAYASYAVLFVCVLVLMQAANMNTPFWIAIGVLMLVGYLLAPHAIWHLCTATHATEDADTAEPGQQALHVFHQGKGG